MTQAKSTIRRFLLAAGGSCALIAAAPAHATVVTDPAGDFIPTFTGTRSGDLDVLSAFGTYDGTTFHIGATVNAPVGTLASSLYVFGFNRGAGTSNFAAIGLPNVVFDAVVTLTGTSVATVRDLVTAASTSLPSSDVRIAGTTLQIDVPAALLPSLGFAPGQYQVNVWPRDSAGAAGNGQIADFAPNASDFTVSTVPEPWSIAALASGLFALTLVRSRRRG